MKEIRGNGKAMLVLDAGDLLFKKFSNPIQEGALKKSAEKARLIIESFNLMGYDALGIGDDDLSLGKDFLLEISKKANFPFLSSNVIDEESGKPLFSPHMIKEINGLRVGIFSLLSPDSFLGQADSRKKGLIIRSPVETAQSTVKELQPKTDLIILLSHLGYPKDEGLAKTVSGIHFILGSHTGINLVHPRIINQTTITQTASKGMYAARLDITFYSLEPFFYNTATKRFMEHNLDIVKSLLNEKKASEAERAQWQKSKEEIEKVLKQFQGKNEYTNIIMQLSGDIKDHPDIGKAVGVYLSKFPETGKTQPGR